MGRFVELDELLSAGREDLLCVFRTQQTPALASVFVGRQPSEAPQPPPGYLVADVSDGRSSVPTSACLGRGLSGSRDSDRPPNRGGFASNERPVFGVWSPERFGAHGGELIARGRARGELTLAR